MKKWFILFTLCFLVMLAGCLPEMVETAVVDVQPTPVAMATATEPAVQTTAPTETQPTHIPTSEPENADGGLLPSALFDVPWDERTLFVSGLLPEAQHWANDLPGAPLYRIELTIPEGLETINGREEIVFTNQEDSALNELILRLFPNVMGGAAAIENLRVNGEAVEVIFENHASTARVALSEPLLPGERLLVQLDFYLQIPREMGGNYGLFGFFEDVLTLDLFYPVIPVYDADGWYADIPPENGDPSYYDAGFYLVRVIAPEALVLAASGVTLSQEIENGQQTTTFAIGPARDFCLAASENFSVASTTVGETRVNSYTLPGHEEAQQLAANFAAAAIQVFDERIGSFDYTEFDVVATPMLAGGVEYPGMTWINMDYYNLNESFYGMPASTMLETVIAHEVGHHWFYNVVGNSQVTEAWLDEALVQYITGLYFYDRYGKSAYDNNKLSWDYRWERIDYDPVPIGLPGAEYEGYEYVGAVYGRGPYFFETLAAQMGEDVFRQFLSDYYQRYHWQIVTGEELKQMAEDYCTCDLTGLFQDWVY